MNDALLHIVAYYMRCRDICALRLLTSDMQLAFDSDTLLARYMFSMFSIKMRKWMSHFKIEVPECTSYKHLVELYKQYTEYSYYLQPIVRGYFQKCGSIEFYLESNLYDGNITLPFAKHSLRSTYTSKISYDITLMYTMQFDPVYTCDDYSIKQLVELCDNACIPITDNMTKSVLYGLLTTQPYGKQGMYERYKLFSGYDFKTNKVIMY